jgi:hypothetical protein
LGVGERSTLKKLEAAARYWLGVDKPTAIPLAVDEGVADGLAVFGFTAESVAEQQAKESVMPLREDFEVHEDAMDSWLFFLKVQRQWVFVPVSAGMGVTAVRMGLNWPGVESMVRLSRVKSARWDGLVDDLLVIEEAVLGAEAKRSAQ